jgi:predicted enzyme related to lactoylglutathione lyase
VSGAQAKGASEAPRTARPSVHVSIDVPDLEAGLRFYGEIFGFIETARPFPTLAILDANNVSVCLHQKAAGSRSSVGGEEVRRYARHWTPVHLDLHVDDFDAVLAKVRAQGGAIENEFRVQGPKPAAFCCDPFGNGFCVIGERGLDA